MSAAEDAVAKAKAIAAKLSGSAAPIVNALDVAAAAEAALAYAGLGGGEKRKRWGDAPVAAADDAAKRTKHEAQKRIWISQTTKPASHYRLYWQQHGLAIGRQVSAGEIALSLQGRGSSTTPSLPGMPEQPLHLLIEGPTMEACENAEPLVEALFIAKADQAETMVDNGGDVPGGAPGTADYSPAPVSSIIQGGGDHYGGGGGATLEEQIGVPNGVVGFIIGRGGESIASMQSRTGCKVQIQKENEMNPGQTERVITLQASTKEAIDQCRSIIQGMVSERTQTSSRDSFSGGGGGGGGGGGSSQEARTKEAVQAGHVLVTVAVPDTDVGLIIGKAGSTIKGIQDRSGANIQIPQSGDLNNPSIRTVSITHPHGEGANLAKELIEDILGSKKNQAPQITIQVEVS
jgi:far upstream element-binding protein